MIDLDLLKLSAYLKTVLSQNEHELVFEKVDKSVRVLKVTRDHNLTPLFEAGNAPAKIKQEVSPNLAVYDVTDQKWKSFKLENIISIDGINKSEIFKLAQITTEI